jgi:RNA polymerase sigma-70 factor (ECF subfamily)
MEKNKATELVDDLFNSWSPFLARYALRVMRSSAVADDVVQEAFLALYRDLRAGKRIENPKAWTLGAVRNQIRKQIRYWHQHSEDLVGADNLDLLAAEPRWPDISAGEDDPGPIPTGVLTIREEEVVLLRLQSFKYREIASQLGISDKSVCTLLARALKKLQAAASHVSRPRGMHHASQRGGRNALH